MSEQPLELLEYLEGLDSGVSSEVLARIAKWVQGYPTIAALQATALAMETRNMGAWVVNNAPKVEFPGLSIEQISTLMCLVEAYGYAPADELQALAWLSMYDKYRTVIAKDVNPEMGDMEKAVQLTESQRWAYAILRESCTRPTAFEAVRDREWTPRELLELAAERSSSVEVHKRIWRSITGLNLEDITRSDTLLVVPQDVKQVDGLCAAGVPMEEAVWLDGAFGDLLSLEGLLAVRERFPRLGPLPADLGNKFVLTEKLFKDKSFTDGRTLCRIWKYVREEDYELPGAVLLDRYIVMGKCTVEIPCRKTMLSVEVHLPVAVDASGMLHLLDGRVKAWQDGVSFSVGGHAYWIDPWFQAHSIPDYDGEVIGTLDDYCITRSDQVVPCARIGGLLPQRFAELDLHVAYFKETLVRAYREARSTQDSSMFISMYHSMLEFFTGTDASNNEGYFVNYLAYHRQLAKLYSWCQQRLQALGALRTVSELGSLIQETAAEICRRFSPADHFVLILGRDCLPIYEVVRRMNPAVAHYAEISRRVIENGDGVKRVVSSIKRLASGRQVVVIDSGFAGSIMVALEANGLELTGYLLSTKNPKFEKFGNWSREQVFQLEEAPKCAPRATELADDLSVVSREDISSDSGEVDPVLHRYFMAAVHYYLIR